MKKRILSLIIAVITVITVTVIPAFAISDKEAEEKALTLIELILYGEMYSIQDNGGGTIEAMYPALVEAIKKDPTLYDKLVESYFDNSDEFTRSYSAETFQKTFYGTESVGIGVTFIIDETATGLVIQNVSVDSPAEAAGLHKGDEIVSIEGVDLSKLPVQDAVDVLLPYAQKEGKSFTVGIVHADGKTEDVKITPAKFGNAASSIDFGTVETDDGTEIGYIYISDFLIDTPQYYKTALDHFEKRGVKSVVIDVRGNLGGESGAMYEMLNATIPAKLPMYYNIEKNYIGIATSDDLTDYAPDIAILIDKDSASAAEAFTAILQHSKVAVVVGENSYGKAIGQINVPLSDGTYLALTALNIKLPNGKDWADKGVTPDVKAVDDLKTEDKDEAFEAAVKILDGTPEAIKSPTTFDYYINCIDDQSTIDVANIVATADNSYWGKDVRFIFRSQNGILLTMNTREAYGAYQTFWYTSFFDTAKYKAALNKAGYENLDVIGSYQTDYGFDAKITLKTDVDAKYFYYWDSDNGTYEAFDGKPSYKDGTLTFTTRKGGLIIIAETKIK
jgi:carboxyl-terminal processing protease